MEKISIDLSALKERIEKIVGVQELVITSTWDNATNDSNLKFTTEINQINWEILIGLQKLILILGNWPHI